jgi:putative phosphoesterase
VISDTHGYLDPQIEELFVGVDYIVHAGDIGSPAVLDALGEIAPVLSVRGNVDRDSRLQSLPERLDLELGGTHLQIVHRLQDAILGPESRIVISGHSHRPISEWRDRILYLNPGAAGRQGFHRNRTVSLLDLSFPPTSRLLYLGPRSLRHGIAGRSQV